MRNCDIKKRLSLCAGLLLLTCLSACTQTVAVTADAEDGVSLPIVMYHSILKDASRAGMYVVSPDTLRADLLFLKEQGYETVVVADLIAYTQGGQLPDKPVMITFDDGYYNNLTYVLPILEELDMRAVISVIGVYTETFSKTPDPNPNYAHLSWQEISGLAATGRVEIQNHSYDMHKQSPRGGSKRKRGESLENYRQIFLEDTKKLQQLVEQNCGLIPTAYTYPYGLISPEAQDYIKEMGFCATLTCYERRNVITRDPECLFGLGRYNRPSVLTTQEFMQKLLKGVK